MSPVAWYPRIAEHVDPSALLMHLWKRALTQSNFSGPLTFTARHFSNFPAAPFAEKFWLLRLASILSAAQIAVCLGVFQCDRPGPHTLDLHLLMWRCFSFDIASSRDDVCVCLHRYSLSALHCRGHFNDEHLAALKPKLTVCCLLPSYEGSVDLHLVHVKTRCLGFVFLCFWWIEL